ncbi:hypothetical protein HYALB_00008016 [Hymenoscyphus albidus]|uniref:MFS general substrate transporter n=1 Tax=Hymenoscyphus albidus TaxID=595503 RepID=A0A9N9PQR9_9HELO|nr:hypothetical protein HYALB_00008016 [Hymenoscyphus albidus]
MEVDSSANPSRVDDHDQAPLLSKTQSHGSEIRPRTESNNSDRNITTPFSLLVFYFMAVNFLLAFGEHIIVAPLIKLFENSLCLSHYGFPDHVLDPELCQIIDVQRPLAQIRGWKSMFDVIPVILVTIPMGRLGDRYGQKNLAALAIFGFAGSLCEILIVCAFPKVFPLQLVWFSSAILLLGGGLNSASAYMSHGFYIMFSAYYIAEMVASFIATVTTDISPWVPCGLSLVSVLACLPVLSAMPNVKPAKPLSESGIFGEGLEARTEESAIISTLKRILRVSSIRNVRFTIPVFLVGILRFGTLNILIQYAHVRFKQKISTGAAYFTETAIVNIFLFLFLIPQVTSYIRREYKIRPQVIDLFLVRSSLTFMCVGALAIGIAPKRELLPIGVAIFAAGFGSRVSGIALLSYWITEDEKSTVYAAVTVLEGVGHAFIDPSMQQIFATSLSLPEVWLAIPFFVAAGCYLIAILSTSCIRIENESDDNEDLLHRD